MMAIPRHLIQFGRSVDRKRTIIEKKGVRMAHAALVKQYNSFAEKLAISNNPDDFYSLADSLSPDEIRTFLFKYYQMFVPVAMMYRDSALSQKPDLTVLKRKASEDEEYISIYSRYLQGLLYGEAGNSITTITGTSVNKIKNIIRNTLYDAEINGWGVEKVKRKIMRSIGDNLRGNGWARSRAIAQTEMIKASNQAAEYAVQSTGYEYRKFWLTSHLEGIRPTHIEAEAESIKRNGLRPDETFNNGLLFPGDPSAPAGEIVNCRCTILHEIV